MLFIYWHFCNNYSQVIALKKLKNSTAGFITVSSLVIVVILALITIWVGKSTSNDTSRAVRTVSVLYLDELAGRREQVVENNLQNNIQPDIGTDRTSSS